MIRKNFYTPMINRTANAIASTQRRGQAFSRISDTPLPVIEENLTEIDADGNFICKMCQQQFSDENAVNTHLLNEHNVDINRFEHS